MDTLSLRARGRSGVVPLQLAPGSTLSDLNLELSAAFQIAIEELEIRSGHPPRLLPPEIPTSTSLKELGIRSGDTLTISQRSITSISSSLTDATLPAAARNARPAPAPATQGVNSSKYVAVDGGYVTLRIVPDDNQCLFHATGMLLAPTPGGSDAATLMRQAVAREIRASPDDFSEVVLGKSPEAYIAHILSPSTWGGAIELAALSKAYRIEIASVDVQSGRIDRYGEGRYSNVVIIVYSGIHYDAITLSHAIPSDPSTWPYDLGFDVLAFSSGVESEIPLLATTEICKQLRAAHYYTDTASFTLSERCESCGMGLVGEKEARDHVRSTGHASFKEYS